MGGAEAYCLMTAVGAGVWTGAVTAGGWWIWQFLDVPLIVPNTTASGLVIANANASGATLGAFAGHVVWDE